MEPHPQRDPFGDSNLLHAGVLVVTLSSLDNDTSHAMFQEGWHAFSRETANILDPLCSPQDIALLGNLSFLIEHEFALVTSNFSSHHCLILLRVYLVPFDLPGVQGRLMNRQDQVLGQYRRFVKEILPRIINDGDYWRGADALPPNPSLFLPPSLVGILPVLVSPSWSLNPLQDSRTMAEIYGELPSPALDELTGHAREILGDEPIFGLRATLYPYQRRSVAAMLHKELPSQPIPDPAYIQVSGVGSDGEMFYLQPATLELLRYRPMTSTVRGGVLCEELGKAGPPFSPLCALIGLGTGKTVMTLSLILSTVDQLPAPPEAIEVVTPMLTPIALKFFPSEPYREARKLATTSRRGAKDEQPGVPSLLETMVHYVRVNSENVGLQPAEEELREARLWEPIIANTPFYFQRDTGAVDFKRPLRVSRAWSPPVPIYLSPATLVLVPQNLLGQWKNEINKHCTSQIPQRVLIIQKDVKIPSPKQLASDYIVRGLHGPYRSGN